MQSISEKNNFDLLRLGLALTVCLAHLGEVTGVQNFAVLAHYFYSGLAVDCFFVVSGFLIFRSYDRSSSVKSYLEKRVRRIYPAYLTTILLAAFLLPLLAAEPGNSFLSLQWWRYLGSNLVFLNFLEPHLPGVFEANPLQAVNGPLWTIKIEVLFYLFVPLICYFLKGKKRSLIMALLYVSSVTYSTVLFILWQKSFNYNYLIMERQLPGQLAFFLAGGLLYYFFPFFKKYAWPLCFAAILALLFHLKFLFYPIYPLALSIVVIFFALQLPFLGNWGKFGDLSYGIYIYHFPLIQGLTAVGFFTIHAWTAFFLLLFLLFFTAYCSYHLVEKPFLRKKSHYRLSEKVGLDNET